MDFSHTLPFSDGVMLAVSTSHPDLVEEVLDDHQTGCSVATGTRRLAGRVAGTGTTSAEPGCIRTIRGKRVGGPSTSPERAGRATATEPRHTTAHGAVVPVRAWNRQVGAGGRAAPGAARVLDVAAGRDGIRPHAATGGGDVRAPGAREGGPAAGRTRVVAGPTGATSADDHSLGVAQVVGGNPRDRDRPGATTASLRGFTGTRGGHTTTATTGADDGHLDADQPRRLVPRTAAGEDRCHVIPPRLSNPVVVLHVRHELVVVHHRDTADHR